MCSDSAGVGPKPWPSTHPVLLLPSTEGWQARLCLAMGYSWAGHILLKDAELWPFTEASLPQRSEALSTDCTCLHRLHFQYYCSMSLKSASLSCNIPTQPRCSMAYHRVCSLPITSCYLTQYSPFPSLFETLHWVCCFLLCCFTAPLASLCLMVPELVFCIVSLLISLFIYHQLVFCFIDWYVTLFSVCRSADWQTPLTCFDKCWSVQRNSEFLLWHYKPNLLPQSVTLMQWAQSQAGSLAVQFAEPINTRSNYQLVSGLKITNADDFE